jgi:hypothetical protein
MMVIDKNADRTPILPKLLGLHGRAAGANF